MKVLEQPKTINGHLKHSRTIWNFFLPAQPFTHRIVMWLNYYFRFQLTITQSCLSFFCLIYRKQSQKLHAVKIRKAELALIRFRYSFHVSRTLEICHDWDIQKLKFHADLRISTNDCQAPGDPLILWDIWRNPFCVRFYKIFMYIISANNPLSFSR